MPRDPIVEQVRAARERLAKNCDFDIRKIIERAQQSQAKSANQVVSFEKKPRRRNPRRDNESPGGVRS